MKNIGFLTGILLSVSLTAGPAQAESDFLSRAEIKSTVDSSVWTGINTLGNPWTVRYQADGKMSGSVKSAKGDSVDTGEWWLDGNKFCSQYKEWFGGKPSCFLVKTEGSKIRLFDNSQKLVDEINFKKY